MRKLFLILVILSLSGCYALNRGSIRNVTDNTLFFSEIGFLISDNPGLTRNAVIYPKLQYDNYDLIITVPYSADTTDLVLYYKVVGKDTVVKYFDTAINDWSELISGVTHVSFNDGSNPQQMQIRIEKNTSQYNNSREFSVNVTKIIRPKLMNPPADGDAGPFTVSNGNPFIISIVDEDGKIIPDMGNGTINSGNLSWDDLKMDILNLGSYSSAYNGYPLDIVPRYSGKLNINCFNGFYVNQHGYKSVDTEISFIYSPPKIYLSQNGNDSNSGFLKNRPVKTWAKAVNLAVTHGISEIDIQASNEPYDTSGAETINSSQPVNIFGGWNSDFTSRNNNEDWEERTPTILTNTAQSDGQDQTNQSYVLQLDSISDYFIVDNVTFIIDAAGNLNIDNAAALLLNNSSVKLNQVTCRGDNNISASSFNSSITLINNSDPEITESRFLGSSGGSGESAGMTVVNSNCTINSSYISGGDLSGTSTGLLLQDNSYAMLNWCYIMAGILDPENNSYTENNNAGIIVNNSELNIGSVWIHAAESDSAGSASNGIYIQNSSSANKTVNITASTIITDSSYSSSSCITASGDASSHIVLKVTNSVLLAGISTNSDSTGMNLNYLDSSSQLLNNAVKIKSSVSGTAVGINLSGTMDFDLINNLMWTDDTDNFTAVQSSSDISTSGICNNDFWDTGSTVDMDLGDGNGVRDLLEVQNNTASIYGNVIIPIPVDMSYTYSSDSEISSMGRISGTIPADIAVGGMDLNNSPYYLSHDRLWKNRNGSSGVGYSMGPYEYDGNLPSVIFVAPESSGGSDFFPLGTKEAPFATLKNAYAVARTDTGGRLRTDVTEIRVAQGTYTENNPDTFPVINTGPDIKIMGGYRVSDWSRDIANYTTTLQSDNSSVLTFDSSNIGNETLFEGFTVKNTAAGGSDQRTVNISGGASPNIRNNIILGTNNNGISNSAALYISDSSSVIIKNNKIVGGLTQNNSYGIRCNNSSGLIIFANNINAGVSTNTYGIYSADCSDETIFGNKIYGGQCQNQNSEASGIYLENSETVVVNNIIHGGNSDSGVSSFGIHANYSTLKDLAIYNNTIYTGFRNNSPYYLTGIFLETSGSSTINIGYIINNLILIENNGKGITENSSYIHPASFYNNKFVPADYNAAGIYYNTSTNYNTVSDIENYLNNLNIDNSGTGIEDPNIYAQVYYPEDYLVQYTSKSSAADFFGDNWHLTGTGNLNAQSSAKDLSNDHVFPFTKDFSGNNRTVPWSAGAYEY